MVTRAALSMKRGHGATPRSAGARAPATRLPVLVATFWSFSAVVAVVSAAGCDGRRDGAGAATAPDSSRAAGAAPAAVAAGSPRVAAPESAVERNAYGHALVGLPKARWQEVHQGKAVFVATWVAPGGGAAERTRRGPSSQVREGLGPLFNATSCESCHFKDGRGGPPPDLRRPAEAHSASYLAPLGPMRILRLGARDADPVYGSQLQDRARPGHAPEGGFTVEPRVVTGRYADGAAFSLEAPVPKVGALRDGPLAEAAMSLRQPLSLIGLGLLEAVPDAALLALADPDDQDGDGISGRPNRVRDPSLASGAAGAAGASGASGPSGATRAPGSSSTASLSSDATLLGRFGWKAGKPSLRLQNAAALREDLGVSTTLFPDAPCAPDVAGCAAPVASSSPSLASLPSVELADADLELLTRYLRLLEPPARRDREDAQVLRGESLFAGFGCASTFAPYTDLLLHDMGPELADDRPEGEASGREWRTAPLWGLGRLEAVTGAVHLLHDGRARTVEEAILWHGGEAQASRDAFVRAAAVERADLLRFLESL